MFSDTCSWEAQHEFLHDYFLVLQIQLLVQFPLQESEYNNQVEKNASPMQISVGRHKEGEMGDDLQLSSSWFLKSVAFQH